MKKLNKKGFTLIELLAVIVILGVLMLVAIPAVTRYITNAKKETFRSTAIAYIDAARNEIALVQEDGCSINLSDIKLEKGNSNNYVGYVQVVSGQTDGDSKYKIYIRDVNNKYEFSNKKESEVKDTALNLITAVDTATVASLASNDASLCQKAFK